MSLRDNNGALSRAAKDLLARWNDVKGVWADAQSQEFEKVYIFQIEQDVRSALSALDQMEEILQKIKSDCE
jgi:thymidylate synthase